jgi:hypothetical protein
MASVNINGKRYGIYTYSVQYFQTAMFLTLSTDLVMKSERSIQHIVNVCLLPSIANF